VYRRVADAVLNSASISGFHHRADGNAGEATTRTDMSTARIAAAAALFTLLSAADATAKPVTVSTDTNLRKAPGTGSEILTLIPKGTTVEVGTCNNGWCQASLNGQDGYAIAQNLGMALPPRRGIRRPVDVYEDEVEEGPPVAYGPGYRPYPYGYGPYPYGYYGYRPWFGFGWGWGWRRW
jgi:uncharacterized protein YraI